MGFGASVVDLLAADITTAILVPLSKGGARNEVTLANLITGLGLGLTTAPLSQFAVTTSAQLAGLMSDATGSGALVFGTSPTLITPALGTPASGTLTNCTGYPYTALTGAPSIPTGANPSASIGLSAVNGSASTFLRSDGAPALSQAIIPTWSQKHTFGVGPVVNTNAGAAPTPLAGYGLQVVGTDATVGRVEIDSFGAIGAYTIRRANGTGAAPTAIVSGDQIGGFNFYSYYVTGGPGYAGPIGSIQGYATQNQTSTNNGSKVVIATTPNNSTTLTTALTIDQDQSLTTAGVATIAPATRTTGSATYFAVTAPADTTLTASTEAIGSRLGGNASAATVIRQFATGALATQRENVFVAPTYGFVGASTITTAATVAITAAPIAGTNATLTKSYALWVQAGLAQFDGLLQTANGSSSNCAVAVGASNTGLFNGGANLALCVGGTTLAVINSSNLIINSTSGVQFGSSGASSPDVGIGRNANVVLEVNNNTAGRFASLITGTYTATTNAVVNGVQTSTRCSGTPAAGLGSGHLFTIDDSTTTNVSAGRMTCEWIVATHASRTARTKLSAFDTAEREGLRIDATGAAAQVGIGGAVSANGNLLMVNGTTETAGDVKLGVAGNKLYVKEGTNASLGTGTLVGGTATISTTAVTANTRVFISDAGGGVLANIGSLYVSARVAGTSFTVSSSNALDTSNFVWLLVEPA